MASYPSDAMPEREADPRDDQVRYSRGQQREACLCGRATVVRNKCSYCLHAEHAAAVKP